MAPPRSGNTSKKPNKKESSKKKPSSSSSQAQPRRTTSKTDPNQHHHAAHQNHELNISTTIPLTLQQLLLNVFKTALLTNGHNYLHNREETKQNDDEDATTTEATGDSAEQQQQEQLDIKSLIQTIKTHLYNRDFDSAFTDANEDLLRAYALRWSSSRALGYAGIFRALLKEVIKPVSKDDDAAAAAAAAAASTKNVVCIGGGAGAEIVALAAAWRDFLDGAELRSSSSASDEGQIADAVKAVSLDDGKEKEEREEEEKLQPTSTSATATTYPGLSVTAVDIADWSKVVERLSTAIRSPTVTGSKSHPAPLLSSNEDEEKKEKKTPGFNVQFEKLDVLSAGEKELQGLFSRQGAESCSTALVTLMFTLNELFSTSMAKATGFLLRMTDLLRPGTVLLVVDSPGSYSTLKLGKGGDGEVRERQYPMKFLLDHTLLSVAEGKWERLLSQDSRWWRRDAARLKYDVGEGAGLEDMRFQVHVYRRVGE